MSTPWTLGGRHNALQKAITEIYERYFASGPRWVAKHLPQRNQMRDYADKITPESKEILLGDYGVESFIEDYAVMAIQASGDSIATRQTYTQWVFDESRHSKALWFCLVDSALYSEKEMSEYTHKCEEDVWTFERQTGKEATPERGAAYAIAQERQTKKNYRDMQRRVWEEYGSPRDRSARPVYPAIAGALGTLATDEGYHEGVFRRITRAYLKYWPDKALQAMWDVYEKYRMPMVKLPNAEAFIDAVLATGIDSPRAVIKDILQPTYESLGLESRAAVKRAAQGSWDLPEGAVIQIGDMLDPEISEDAIPYRMNPDGTFTAIAEEAPG